MIRALFAAALFALLGTPVFAQSSPGFTYGQVPTPAQWNSYFAAKQDLLGYTPVNRNGDTMTGKLVTTPPVVGSSGFNLSPGTAPGSPNNGDLWTTSLGLYVQINGVTYGPLIGTSSTAGGDLSGTYPNPTVAKVNGVAYPASPSTTTVPVVTGTNAVTYEDVPVNAGGTGLSSGTSGGVPYFSSTTAMQSSGLLTANALVLGGGAGSAPTALGSLGTSTTVLHGNASGAPTFGSVSLATDVSNTLQAAQFPALTGNVTTSAGSLATTIANNAVTNAKLATMGAATIKANVTGGSAVPTDATLTSILDTLSTTQGSILYRNSTSWVALGPGTSGQALTTGGAGANPQWSPAAGTGTVTSVATNSGLTGGPVTTTGTIGIASNGVTNSLLAQMNAHTYKGNNTGSTANAADVTSTQLTADLNAMVGDSGSGGTKGLVPAPASGSFAAGYYLDAGGNFSQPSGQVVLANVVPTAVVNIDTPFSSGPYKQIIIEILGMLLTTNSTINITISSDSCSTFDTPFVGNNTGSNQFLAYTIYGTDVTAGKPMWGGGDVPSGFNAGHFNTKTSPTNCVRVSAGAGTFTNGGGRLIIEGVK